MYFDAIIDLFICSSQVLPLHLYMTRSVSFAATIKWNFSRIDQSSMLSFNASNDTYYCPSSGRGRRFCKPGIFGLF